MQCIKYKHFLPWNVNAIKSDKDAIERKVKSPISSTTEESNS